MLDSRLPRWAWLWLPLFVCVVTFGARLVDGDLFIWLVNDELGPGENLTAVAFMVACICGFKLAADRSAFDGHWVRSWFAVIGTICLFVAGEEISWGQHFFGWATPDWLAEINKQKETNLHNTAENLLDQKPRSIASIAVLLACLAPLLYRRGRLAFLDRYPALLWLMPRTTLALSGVLVVAPRIVDRAQVWFDVMMPEPFYIPTRHYQEIQEHFMGLFAALYMIDLVLRARAARTGKPGADAGRIG